MLWTATLVSNTGTWMHDVAAAWLMTSLSPSPLMVSLVQSATAAAMALFALPAGALADLVDRRKLLLALNFVRLGLAGLLAALAFAGAVTVEILLGVTFALGVCSALMAPAWQSVVPLLVPKPELKQAVALNSMGINVARAIGPAAGGAAIVGFGPAIAFLANALSEIAVIAALLLWKAPARAAKKRPERFVAAMVAGLRYAANAPDFAQVLKRALLFFPFASAYWALLPLVARDLLGGDAALFGLLIGAVGAGAVAGALAMPSVDRRIGSEGLLLAGSLGTAGVLAVFALVPVSAVAIAACFVAGTAWIFTLSTLNVAAQSALPDWVRGRGLSIYGLVSFGAMALGAAFWGWLATLIGVAASLGVAAIFLAASAAFARHFALAARQGDLAPSGHWPEPPALAQDAHARGPVMVQIEYRIAPEDRDAFLRTIAALAGERRRDGAIEWDVFEDAADPGRFVESFVEEDWSAHLRHHDRVTHQDADLQAAVAKFHRGPAPPAVVHLVAAAPRD